MDSIIKDLIERVPNYKEFLTVDELNESSKKLAEENPDLVKIFEIGKTRDGNELYCLKIGSGSNNGLMFGLPHPNEPIGTMMLEYFTKELVENKELRDKLDYTWYIVKAWDTDGAKLNEKWFKGPYTLYNYSRNFFRPAGHQQVDWTFPINYKKLNFKDTIPETKAMMDLIDEIKPKFIYSLHNAGFGGVYWYISEDISDIYEDLKNAADKQEIPLHLGEPEAPYCIPFAPAVYKELGIRDNYDYLEKYGIEDPSKSINVGTCSADYAKERYNSFTLLTELPYFYDKRINDLSESDISRKEAVLESIKFNQDSEKFIVDLMNKVKRYVYERNPFKLALEAFTDNAESNEATINMVNTDEKFLEKATEAEKFDNLLITKFYKMLSLGMLVRLMESELEEMKNDSENNIEKKNVLEESMVEAERELKKLSDYLEKEIHYDVVPIKKLVSIQLECGLIVADYLNNN